MSDESLSGPGECAFTFGLGHLAIACRFERDLSDVARSFVQPMGNAAAAVGSPSLFVCARRGIATSPAMRGLASTCIFGDATGYTAPGRIELWDESSLVVAELDGRTVRADVGPASDPHFVGTMMLFAATALTVRAHGLFHLHAGCVDVPALGTVLIVGESGAGKTTLSLGLAALGGRLVSDDAVFLSSRPQGDGIDAWGWPADLHLTPATLCAFPDLVPHAYRAVSDGRDKRAVPVAALARPWLPCARNPRFVLFPKVGSASSSSSRQLDTAETVTQLIPQSGLALVPGAANCAEHLQLLAHLANDAIGLEITLGADGLPPGPRFVGLLKGAQNAARALATRDRRGLLG